MAEKFFQWCFYVGVLTFRFMAVTFLAFQFILFNNFSFAQEKENTIKNDAEKYFASGDFFKAQEEYRKLVKIKPRDLIYNAKLGVCLLNIDSVKSSCLKYLYFAASQSESSSLSIFYLAKALHMNCKFDEAIVNYLKFKNLVSEKDVVAYDVERQIEMCKNGKALMGKPLDTDFLNKKSVNRDFFTSGYDFMLNEAKIYSVPEDFKSDIDKKEKFTSVMCLYNQETMAAYSSFGKTLKNGKDLCRRVKFGKEWSKASPLEELNSVFDEEYPFVLADGTMMYFSSKGHNSMGGFDIFKTAWNKETGKWSKPENLGFPINSPFDDLLFIPNRESETASFASDRSSPIGKMEIFKIRFPQEFGSLAIIEGNFQPLAGTGPNKARITVINLDEDKLAGIFNLTEKNGRYVMALTPGGKYRFSFQSKGFAEHSFIVDVPMQEKKFVLKQLIRAEKDFQIETVIAYNFFTEAEADLLSDQLMEALSEDQHSSDFSDILDRHVNVAISEISVEKANEEKALELVQLKHSKGVKKSKSEVAFQEALQTVEKKKQAEAENAFQLDDFPGALKIYSELLTYKPQNPDFNYKFGVCIFKSERDKAAAIPFLKTASANPSTPDDVFFYLARIYHLNKQFDEAIENYKKFAKISSPADITALDIERRITNCNHAKTVSKMPPFAEMVVEKTVSVDRIFQSFNSHEFSGKILLTPDDFKTDLDKKNGFKSTMFLTNDSNEVFYASYGIDSMTGKDIYKRVKLSNGQWGQPQCQVGINTPQDEDYPFIGPSGTIFFSSKGHNSMGGFDIFCAEWVPGNQAWSTPVNLAPPVNSPSDDFFFIRCKDGVSVYFSSDRKTFPGQMDIFSARVLKP